MRKKSLKAKAGDDNGFFEPYADYSRTLRTWLVAYGIGGPAVMITHPDALVVISANGQAALIGWLFLAGVAAQVLIAFLNKIAMWYVYFGEVDATFENTMRTTRFSSLQIVGRKWAIRASRFRVQFKVLVMA